jgi:hypothetical protein
LYYEDTNHNLVQYVGSDLASKASIYPNKNYTRIKGVLSEGVKVVKAGNVEINFNVIPAPTTTDSATINFRN